MLQKSLISIPGSDLDMYPVHLHLCVGGTVCLCVQHAVFSLYQSQEILGRMLHALKMVEFGIWFEFSKNVL